jgi:hypothetical protein
MSLECDVCGCNLIYGSNYPAFECQMCKAEQTIQRQAKEISLLEESLDLNLSFTKLQKGFLDNGIYDPDALKELIFKNEQTKQELEKLRSEE